jgi:hypothetical protein
VPRFRLPGQPRTNLHVSFFRVVPSSPVSKRSFQSPLLGDLIALVSILSTIDICDGTPVHSERTVGELHSSIEVLTYRCRPRVLTHKHDIVSTQLFPPPLRSVEANQHCRAIPNQPPLSKFVNTTSPLQCQIDNKYILDRAVCLYLAPDDCHPCGCHLQQLPLTMTIPVPSIRLTFQAIGHQPHLKLPAQSARSMSVGTRNK